LREGRNQLDGRAEAMEMGQAVWFEPDQELPTRDPALLDPRYAMGYDFIAV